MEPKTNFTELNVSDFAMAFEELTRIFIRMPSIEKLSFTTLSVLHTLSLRSPMRLNELIATEQVTQSAITQLVTRLERDGLVERRPDPSDGRAVLVHITPQGASVIDSRRTERIMQITRLIEGLSPGERAAIASALPALTRLAELGNA
ncbi:MarR family winged helix-turn-helix transcriptional regulator [Paenibacillus elgii]|uniref:MarR family winged helix-turn-helix transcriptional regulator n=1 Tax=Paenibacillus elgii TaxID=189691 RepID=UPI0020401301|nr:MarR family transcriptional regulator [Paenibacillus elgii]MCM3269733.1 MarR family transcriptional regulator [Paenibacillus elgii]